MATGNWTKGHTTIYNLESIDGRLKMPKGVIRIRKSKKDRQRNSQKKNDKSTNKDLQNIYIKLKLIPATSHFPVSLVMHRSNFSWSYK